MQVNFNPQQNNQQFGMAIHSNEVVNKIIKNRIKTPEQLERLSSIIDKAAENTTLDIHLYVNPDEKTIGANISSASDFGTRFHRCLSENWFSRTFGGGIVGFIEKCSKIADKNAPKIKQLEDIANSYVFNKICDTP